MSPRRSMPAVGTTVLTLALLTPIGVALLVTGQQTATDPGPRKDAPDAGGPFPNLSTQQVTAFNNGKGQFEEDEPVPNSPPGGGNGGLGPGYNGTSCVSCHQQPAPLGSSPSPQSVQNPVKRNPQIDMATENGATNTVPSFINANGPVREARFIRNPDGSADGGVHDLFTIAGRADAPGCTLGQPDFAGNLARNNVIFRIPTPLYGLGLVEATPDSTLEQNLASTATLRAQFGIGGRFNRETSQHSWKHQDLQGPGPATQGFNPSGNDGTIMKFGWKAQNKSLTIFAAEAYNVEMGVTNDLFPNERNEFTGCMFTATPEDGHATTPGGESDVDQFVDATRYSAPAAQNTTAFPDISTGAGLFKQVGCVLCHTDTLVSGNTTITAEANFTYHPYSDFAIHHMGENLADGVSQGNAGPDEFRTAPLWGAGQRVYFLHDGRSTNLMDVIQQHKSRGSEANGTVRQFNALTPTQQQAVLDFIRSL